MVNLKQRMKMGASKEYFLRIEQQYFEQEFSPLQRGMFSYCELKETNEYENNKGDTIYLSLLKAKRKAKKDLDTYLFNKRNK